MSYLILLHIFSAGVLFLGQHSLYHLYEGVTYGQCYKCSFRALAEQSLLLGFKISTHLLPRMRLGYVMECVDDIPANFENVKYYITLLHSTLMLERGSWSKEQLELFSTCLDRMYLIPYEFSASLWLKRQWLTASVFNDWCHIWNGWKVSWGLQLV